MAQLNLKQSDGNITTESHLSFVQITEHSFVPTIDRKVILSEKGTVLEYSLEHTHHSHQRSLQRSIDPETIARIVDFGVAFPRQGMVFYTVVEKELPVDLSPDELRKLRNLVVVLDRREKIIITCYRSKNSVKWLKQKTKRLSYDS